MNTQIIDRHKNWNILLFKEAIKIIEIKPSLNIGLKASKELQQLELLNDVDMLLMVEK